MDWNILEREGAFKQIWDNNIGVCGILTFGNSNMLFHLYQINPNSSKIPKLLTTQKRERYFFLHYNRS